ncbi:MAG: YbaB/EbfC family nucleoid-associated protein [Clostridiales bacterium]|nr:YbaB/EbfC family nucleoid-associated protein [Clostridiales bacterium]
MARGGFPGMGGGNMQQLARQAAKLQQQIQNAQEELAQREYEAAAGGGVVTARVNGKHELVALNIKPEAVDPDDVEMLTDLIVAAVNTAMKQAEEDSEKTMGKLTGGINMPGLF